MQHPQQNNTPVINPLVSIIVPIYNAAQWLGEMLDSLQNQEYTRWEAILVNDGSTDDSAEICRLRALGDPRLKLVTKPNGGQSSARNLGISIANGDWLVFVDADDAMQPNMLRRLLETVYSTHVDIAICDFHYSDKITQIPMPALPRVMKSYTAIMYGLFQKIHLNSVWGAIYNRKIFFPDGPRFAEGLLFEDLDIFYRLFERADKIAYLPEKLYFYRDNPSSFMNNMSQGRFDALTVTDRILEHYRGTKLERAARDRRFSANYNLLLLMLATNYDAPDKISQCYNVIKQERCAEIFTPGVRLKNRIGAAASFLGLKFIKHLARHTKY